VNHHVNFADLQQVVGRYFCQYDFMVAGGPLAASGIVRAFVAKNKLVSAAIAPSGVWFVIREMPGPVLDMIQDRLAQLQSIIGIR
jgi:hypothetical protein